MVVIDNTHDDPRYKCQTDDRLGRQRAFDIMRQTLQDAEICPACATSGALHIAATAWLNSLDKPVDEFLELVKAVLASVQSQKLGDGN